MSTTSAYLNVQGIDIDVVYKDIKNLHVGVYPPLGRVRVSAPRQLDDDQIRLAVVHRLSWIKRQQARLHNADRQSLREMVTGESHYVSGLRCRLTVIEGPGRTRVELAGTRLQLCVPPGSTAQRRREVLDRWYRQRLRAAIPGLIAKWEPKLNVRVPRWSIRRMKTKWGSCNRESGYIWFNVELAKKHAECLEYIVVHEMTHHLERNHTERFTKLMDAAIPDWRARRDRLNESPLSAEEWTTA